MYTPTHTNTPDTGMPAICGYDAGLKHHWATSIKHCSLTDVLLAFGEEGFELFLCRYSPACDNVRMFPDDSSES